MKLVWSPEAASKVYIETVKKTNTKNSSVAELVSAMAAGWNAVFIVETWFQGGATAISIGLAIASRYINGRHLCIVPDEISKAEYVQALGEAGFSPEIIIGEAEEVMDRLNDVNFLVVDSRQREFSKVFRLEKLSNKGGVLICKNAKSDSSFQWRSVAGDGSRRVVRSVFLPVGEGLYIAHVGTKDVNSSSENGKKRWFKHYDQHSGEEYVIRKIK